MIHSTAELRQQYPGLFEGLESYPVFTALDIIAARLGIAKAQLNDTPASYSAFVHQFLQDHPQVYDELLATRALTI